MCATDTPLALHLETLGYNLRLFKALNGLVYFLITSDPRGDNRMGGSMFLKLLTKLGIQTEDADFNLMGEMFTFAYLAHKKSDHYTGY